MGSKGNTSDQRVQAYVHFGTWDDTTRAHPAMKWMENYTRNIIDDKRWDEPAENHHASDFFVQKPNGEFIKGADAAFKTIRDLYSPFKAFRHEPTFLVYWDYEGGNEWGMMGAADVWFQLHGLSGDAVSDREGNRWDGHGIGAFLFRYADEGDGIKLKSTQIYTDSSPAMKMMLEKGMLDAESLKSIVIGS